ncbi:MAG: hypothetical protein AB1705_22130 [Verrucomicrobiota bacterium]
MKTITIRDLRQRWPAAEKALEVENEILITRDGKPVAKLVRVTAKRARRKRWDAEEHGRWQHQVAGEKVICVVDDAIAKSRAERQLIRKSR